MYCRCTVYRQCIKPTNYTLICGYVVGGPIAHEADMMGIDGRNFY